MFVLVELVIRAERWRVLLRPAAPVRLRSSFAYLTIGYFANLLLPARLGDVTRAYLSGSSFGISSLVTLGTIVVERVADTAVILLVVLLAGLAVAPSSQVAGWAELVAVAVGIGLAVAVLVGIVVLRSASLMADWPATARHRWPRSPRAAPLSGARARLRLSWASPSCHSPSRSARSGRSRARWVWRSTPSSGRCPRRAGALDRDPGGPGSLGTYEFAGVTVLGILGVGSSQALAATVLIHVMALFPSALLGLVATLVLHVRIADIEAAGTVPASVTADG